MWWGGKDLNLQCHMGRLIYSQGRYQLRFTSPHALRPKPQGGFFAESPKRPFVDLETLFQHR